MAIEVKGWRKPKLTLSLVAGGTLLANRTYYVCGYLKFTPVIYGAVGSLLSDVYSITTDSTNRSIQIDQKTERDITAFASGGGSVTNVTCPLHCVKTGDVIKIDTGSYAGSWTVTKIDKDTFSIPTAYIDNVAVVCYTDSINYNRPTLAGWSTNSFCMTYYVSTINPINISGYWSATSNYWTSTSYQANNYTNPTVITSQPTQSYMYSRSGSLTASFIGYGMFAPVVPYGTILVYVTASHTFQEIYDAIIAEGFPYNCYYSSTENTFTLVGSIIGNGTGYLTATGMNITMVCGELYNGAQANFSFNGCMINTIPRLQQASYRFTANQAVIYNNNNIVAIYGYIYGTDTYHRAPMLFNGNDGTTSYTNLQTGDVFTNVGLIQDKIIVDNYVTSNIQASYGNAIFKRDTLLPMYWTLINIAKDYEPSVYMMEDCIINEAGSNNWHFRFYQYPAQDGKVNIVKFLNIDTDDSLNRKKCINNRIGNYNMSFYRRMEFYITDEIGNPIESASITLTDNIGTIYTGSTDLNGYSYIDFKEQKFYKTDTQGTESAWSGNYDTYYAITDLEIIADGYETYSLKSDSYNMSENVIKLKTAILERETEEGNILSVENPEMGSSARLLEL